MPFCEKLEERLYEESERARERERGEPPLDSPPLALPQSRQSQPLLYARGKEAVVVTRSVVVVTKGGESSVLGGEPGFFVYGASS